MLTVLEIRPPRPSTFLRTPSIRRAPLWSSAKFRQRHPSLCRPWKPIGDASAANASGSLQTSLSELIRRGESRHAHTSRRRISPDSVLAFIRPRGIGDLSGRSIGERGKLIVGPPRLDAAGLITPEVEATLRDELKVHLRGESPLHVSQRKVFAFEKERHLGLPRHGVGDAIAKIQHGRMSPFSVTQKAFRSQSPVRLRKRDHFGPGLPNEGLEQRKSVSADSIR